MATVAANSVLGKVSGVGKEVKGITIGDDGVLAKVGTGDIASLSASAGNVLAKLDTGDLGFQSAADFSEGFLQDEIAGSSFPTMELWDGRPFYRTDLYTQFYYDSTASGWVGAEVLTLHAGETVSETTYLDIIPFNQAYNGSNIGWDYPFDVKPVWMTGRVAGTSTCTITVRAEGSNVSSAVLTWTAEAGKKYAEFLGGTITSGDNISFAVDTGTANPGAVPILVHAGFRRFET